MFLFLLACSNSAPPPPAAPAPAAPSEIPADAGPAASLTVHKQEPGKSLPFTLVIGMSPEAKQLLTSKGETVKVSVDFNDGVPGDDGGYRSQEFDVPGDGGIVEVPGVDLSPVKPANGPLTQYGINVYSARKSSPDNLINCDFLGGSVTEIAPRAVIACKPL